MSPDAVLFVVFAISILSLVVAGALARQVLSADTGKPEMQRIADAIREGAEAFLWRQYRTIALLAIVVGAAIGSFYWWNRAVPNVAEMGAGTFWKVAVSFLTGALCSGIAGWIGMFVSIRANLRAAAAVGGSLNRGLQIALRGGAVSGLAVVAMECSRSWTDTPGRPSRPSPAVPPHGSETRTDAGSAHSGLYLMRRDSARKGDTRL